jgi:hypothetical protein
VSFRVQDASFKEQAALKMEVLSMKHAVNEMEQNCDLMRDQANLSSYEGTIIFS